MKRYPRRALFAVGLAALPVSGLRAAEVLVRTPAELSAAITAAQPGDSIVLRNGIWSGINLNNRLIPSGTAAAPITIRAQTPGQVVIAGPSLFDVRGSHYVVTGLSFKDENPTLKSIRFRGDNAQVFDNMFLDHGRYNQVFWDVIDDAQNPTSRFSHNFLAGKQDRGVALHLDNSRNAQVHNNYFGHRDRGGPSGHTNGWETIRIGNSGIMNETLGAVIRNNYFEATEGEDETISDKTTGNFIRDNTFKDIRKGYVTARHGAGSTYEGNYFINALGIRVGNSEDTIPDHPNLTIRNNYMEGANAKILLPGYQTQVSISGNTVVVTAGSFLSNSHTVGRHALEYHNTTNGLIEDNVFVINDGSVAAVQARTLGGVAPTATGGGNFAYNLGNGTNTFTSGVPTAMRNLFTIANPHLVRDEMGVLRPTGAADGAGFTGTAGPLGRNSDVGPSWLDPVFRLNKSMVADFRFDGDLSGGAITPTAHNTGYLITPATMKDASSGLVNRHTPVSLGVSGSIGDRAFDNRSGAGMGVDAGSAVVADRTWFRNLQAFTLTGWFRTGTEQSIGNGAVLAEQIDAAGGWSLKSTQTGRLSLTVHDGSTSNTVTSDLAYPQQDEWVFFAVRFDQRPSSNEVEFFVGTDSADIASAGVRSLSRVASSDNVVSDMVIGRGFDGLLDNIRLFGARRNIAWIDEDGSAYTRVGTNHDYALLSLNELRTVRMFDLLPLEQSWAQRWNISADGSWSDSSNWLGGVPNLQDAVVNFSGAIAAPTTVALDGTRIAGIVSFDNVSSYTLAGGTLVLSVSAGAAELNVVRGEHTIASAVHLLADTNLFVRGMDDRLTINGGISASPGVSLAKLGAGRLDVRHVRADGLQVAEGTVHILPDGTAAATSKVRELSIRSGAKLDLTDNAMVVDYAGATPLPQIRALILSAYDNGSWAGDGLGSSMADDAQFGIGYAESVELSLIPAIFGDPASDAVLVRLTRYGDANLDGIVNLSDFNRLAANFGSTSALWTDGDFNYDGVVNLADFNRLAANFGLAAGPGRPTPQDWAALMSVVPEPSVGAGLVIGALAVLRRRRRA